MRKNHKVLLLVLIGCTVSITRIAAQTNWKESQLISAELVDQLVRKNHPVAKQAFLKVEEAGANLRIARGAFDPVVSTSLAEKTLDRTNYYRYNRPELQVPLWFGATLQAGTEELSGTRTLPTETIGQTNYWGLSVPVGRDLLFDKRRAALRTAQLLQGASQEERRRIVNNLLLDAQYAYWNWKRDYELLQVIDEVIKVNQKRYALVQTSVALGERAAIDTAEALAQLQQFKVQWEEASLAFKNSTLELSQFIWDEGNIPFMLTESYQPLQQEISVAPSSFYQKNPLDTLVQTAKNNHPEIRLYNFKIKELAIDRKLKMQQLLPKATLHYNWLGKGTQWTSPSAVLFENNFQYGFKVSLPLRLSTERGEFQRAKIRLLAAELEQDNALQKLELKVRASYNEWMQFQKQAALQEKTWQNYLLVQKGEEIKFNAGESSLFLLNARENKTLEARQKLIELKAKSSFAEKKLEWALGLMNL